MNLSSIASLLSIITSYPVSKFWLGTENGIIKFQVDLSFENREEKNILNVRDRNYLE